MLQCLQDFNRRLPMNMAARLLLVAGAVFLQSTAFAADDGAQPLFPEDGPVGAGWTAREWNDVGIPPKLPSHWEVRDGVLIGAGGGSGKEWSGGWLLSEAEYGDFVIEFDFHLGGAKGNGGLALRAPLRGDPAFDGMELQMTDPRFQYGYFPNATWAQLTGGIYLAVAPLQYAYLADEWNHLKIDLRGSQLKAWLNGVKIHDTDLDHENAEVHRHDDPTPVLPVSRRPRRGHLGFQDLGEDGDRLRVRNAKLTVLD